MTRRNRVIAASCAFCFFLPIPAIAGAWSYQCKIAEHFLLANNGSLKRPPIPHLIGKRFSIDRFTGALVGPDYSLWATEGSKTTVLARGNQDNAFLALISEPGAKGGVHLTVVMIEEFFSGNEKPFVVSSGGTVASGTCE